MIEKKFLVGSLLILLVAVTSFFIFQIQDDDEEVTKLKLTEETSQEVKPLSPVLTQISPISPVLTPISPILSVTPRTETFNLGTTVTVPNDLSPSDETLGVVTGVIVDPSTGQAIANADLFLGLLEGLEDGFPIITMRQDNSPYAVSDETGRFVFMDILPGQYGLIAWSPIHSVLVNDPKDLNHTLIIEVRPDQVTNLNVIPVDIP